VPASADSAGSAGRVAGGAERSARTADRRPRFRQRLSKFGCPCASQNLAARSTRQIVAARRTSRTRQAPLALALAAAWLLAAPPARAQLNLKWEAPPGCPRRGEVLERIRALAGPSLEKTENLSAEGRITPANGRFYLTLLVRDGRHVRKRAIASDSCADLAGAAAITLALLLGIDVNAAAPPAGAAPRKDSASGTDGQGASKERGSEDRGAKEDERGGGDRSAQGDESAGRSPGPAESPAPRGWNVLLRAPILAADLGPLPNPSVGAGLGVGVRYESWRLVLTGHAYLGQSVDAPEAGSEFDAGADLQRVTGHLSLCRGWRSSGFEIAPCLGLALEYVTAEGFGQRVSPEAQRALWPALSAGAVAHWYPLKSLAFFAGVTGYVELSRPHLVIEGLGEIRQLAPIAAGAVIGVEWIL
jgi:hypothetical protein